MTENNDHTPPPGPSPNELIFVAELAGLQEGITGVTTDGVELVIVKRDELISVFSGLCLHAEAPLCRGFLDGDYLTCGSHLWRYHIKTGELDGEPGIYLKKLALHQQNNRIFVKKEELEDLRDLDDDY